MVTGKDVINQLKKHLGESGSFIWKWYGGGSGWAWCNATVCWAFAQAGAANLYYGGKKVSYCPTSIKWCQANYAQIPMELADAGDVIYFDWEPNGVPNHIGFIRERGTHSVAYTIEGNAGSPSRVRSLTRPAKYIQAVFRVPYPMASKPTSNALAIDGIFSQKMVYCLQLALGINANGILDKRTVKAIQKFVGVTQDGHWGLKTSKAVQKMIGVKQDGDFGENSVRAFQRVINKLNAVAAPEPPAPAPEKKKYSGQFPTLPKRGYFQTGDKGVNVERVQKLLVWLGYKLKVDSLYGGETANAVKDYQKDYKLTVDGKFGRQSLDKAKTIKK